MTGLSRRDHGHLIAYPMPTFRQLDDEDLFQRLATVVFPDTIERRKGENGVQVWVAGVRPTPEDAIKAEALFRTCLGALRLWRVDIGVLEEELRNTLGPVRDDQGNMTVVGGPIVVYGSVGTEFELFKRRVRRALDQDASSNLANSLYLHGRSRRNAADLHVIHEYAELEFGGTKGVREALGPSQKDRFTDAVNNLSPLAGGRHATFHAKNPSRPLVMSIEEQREFARRLLRRWVDVRSA